MTKVKVMVFTYSYLSGSRIHPGCSGSWDLAPANFQHDGGQWCRNLCLADESHELSPH